jgi:hypothetical protein
MSTVIPVSQVREINNESLHLVFRGVQEHQRPESGPKPS